MLFSRIFCLVLLVWFCCSNGSHSETTKHIQDYKHLCSNESDQSWNIAGIAMLNQVLYLTVNSNDDEQTTNVYELPTKAILTTLVDLKNLTSITDIETKWPGLNLRTRKKSILSMFASEEYRSLDHNPIKAAAESSSNGIYFIFNDYSTHVYNPKSDKSRQLSTFPLESEINSLILNENGYGLQLMLAGNWTIRAVEFFNDNLWSKSVDFILLEGPPLVANMPNLRIKERSLIMLYDRNGGGELYPGSGQLFRPVQWKWAHGFFHPSLQFVHLLTDSGVYVFEPPENQSPLIFDINRNQTESQFAILRALKLNYQTYFVCNQSESAFEWNQVVQFMAIMKPLSQNGAQTKSRLIYLLFTLHFVVAFAMILIIVVINLKRSEPGLNLVDSKNPPSTPSPGQALQIRRSRQQQKQGPNTKRNTKSTKPESKVKAVSEQKQQINQIISQEGYITVSQ